MSICFAHYETRRDYTKVKPMKSKVQKYLRPVAIDNQQGGVISGLSLFQFFNFLT